MQTQDAKQFAHRGGAPVDAVPGMHDHFARGIVEVAAGIRHDSVATAGMVGVIRVADDRMVNKVLLHARIPDRPAEEGVGVKVVESGDEMHVLVIFHPGAAQLFDFLLVLVEFLKNRREERKLFAQIRRQIDELRSDARDRPLRHLGPPVRHGHENHPVNERQRRENGEFLDQIQFFLREFCADFVPRAVRDLFDDVVRIVLQKRARDQAAHAVPDQDHLVEILARLLRDPELLASGQQHLAEVVGGRHDRYAAGKREEPELVAFPDDRVVFQGVDHLHPGVWAGHQSVDEDHRDLPRLVRLDQEQPGVIVLFVGLQHDGDQVAVGQTVQETGKRGGEVQRERRVSLRQERELLRGRFLQRSVQIVQPHYHVMGRRFPELHDQRHRDRQAARAFQDPVRFLRCEQSDQRDPDAGLPVLLHQRLDGIIGTE